MSTATAYGPIRQAAGLERRAPRRRRPHPSRSWWCGEDFPGHWPPSIIFPDAAKGWSLLCVEIIEKACLMAVDADMRGDEVDIRTWGGPVPGLSLGDLTAAADFIISEDSSIPFHHLLAAMAEAHAFVGFKD